MTPGRTAAYGSLVLSIVIAVTFVAWNHGRIGVTWDEGVDSTYGEKVVDYFASGFQDRSCDEIVNMRYYGPLAETLAALSYRGAEEAKWSRRHFTIGLFAISTLILTWWIARRTGNWRTAALAPIALMTTPRFVGHALTNSKDIPFAAGIAAVAAAALAIFALRRFSWARFALLGVAIGAALGVRPGGIVVVFMFILATAACSDLVFRGQPRPSERTGLRLLAAIAIGYALMVAVWPFAHRSPLMNPLIGFANAVAFQPSYDVFFEGSVTPSDKLPAYYLLKMLAITTPVAHLLLAAFGAGLGSVAVWRGLSSRRDPAQAEATDHDQASRGSAVTFGLLLTWVSAPILGQAILRANVYDGVRHFLFVLPAVAILAAHGAAGVAGFLGQRGRPRLGVAIAATLLLSPVPAMVMIHPYQYTYFNWTVGGLADAGDRYETDYWALSYREAMDWISARIEARTDDPPKRTYRVLVGGTAFVKMAAEAHARGDVVVEVVAEDERQDWPEGADWYIGVARYQFATETFSAAPIVHRVARDEATLSVIREPPGDP